MNRTERALRTIGCNAEWALSQFGSLRSYQAAVDPTEVYRIAQEYQAMRDKWRI